MIAQADEIDILGAEFEQDTVELCIVVDVLLAALALDLVEWRLRDVNVAGFDQTAHLAEDEGEEEGENVRTVDVRIGHQDDLVVTRFGCVECASRLRGHRCQCPLR